MSRSTFIWAFLLLLTYSLSVLGQIDIIGGGTTVTDTDPTAKKGSALWFDNLKSQPYSRGQEVFVVMNLQYTLNGANRTLSSTFRPKVDEYTELRVGDLIGWAFLTTDQIASAYTFGDLANRYMYLELYVRDAPVFRTSMVPVANRLNDRLVYAKLRTAIVTVDNGKITNFEFAQQPSTLSAQIPVTDTVNNGKFTMGGFECVANSTVVKNDGTEPSPACDRNGDDCLCRPRVYLTWVGTDSQRKVMKSYKTDIWKFQNFFYS